MGAVARFRLRNILFIGLQIIALAIIMTFAHSSTTVKADASTYTYTGTITDQLGEPLSNVQVQLYSNTGGPTEVSAYTDSSGNFSVSALAGTYTVRITDQGLNRNGAQTIGEASVSDFTTGTIATVNLSSSSVTQNFAIALQQLTIDVNDGSGNPEENASIKANGNGGTFNISDGTSNYSPSGNASFNARTDQNGSPVGTTTVLVPEGSLFPAATASSGTDTGICVTYNDNSSACNTSPITVGGDMTVDFNEPPAYTYSGTLTDQNGDPLTNVKVELIPVGGSIVHSATVGSNGQFSITVSEGTYNVELVANNMSTLNVGSDPLAWFSTGIITTVNLTQSNQTQNLSLELSRVSVEVMDTSGNPEAGREVFSSGSAATMTVNAGGTSYTVAGNIELQGVYTNSYGAVTIFVPEGTTLQAATSTSGTQYGVCVFYSDSTTSCSNVAITITNDTSLLLEEGSTSLVAIGSPANVTAVSPTATAPVISWGSVSGAKYYNIYRSGTKIGTTTDTTFIDATTLQSGVGYYYYITAVDNNGLESAPSDLVSVIYDTTPPTITYTISPSSPNGNNGWYDSAVTVTFTCATSVSSVTISSCTSPVTLGDGTNQTATGTAKDSAGNTATVTTKAINIDKTSPTITNASLSSTNITYDSHSSTAISANVTDNLSGVTAGEYYIDTDPGVGKGTALTLSNGKLTGSVDLSTLSAGQHTLYIRAEDKAGNWSQGSPIQFSVNYPVPGAPTNLLAISSLTNQSPVLIWLASPTATSYNIYRNGVKIGNTTNIMYVDSALSTSGSYSYYVTALNQYGAESSPSNTVNVTYDITPPTISYTLSSQPNASGWYNEPVTITFSCSDNLSGVATCPSPITISSQGKNQSVSVIATDKVGNVGSLTVSGLNIDAIPPATLLPLLSSNLVHSGQSVTVTSSVLDNLSGVVGAEYYITTSPIPPTNTPGTGTAMTYTNGTASATFTASGSPSTTYYVWVRSEDAAGNWSPLVDTSYIMLN